YVEEIPLRLIRLDDRLKQAKEGNNQLMNRVINEITNECEDFDYDVFHKFGIGKNEILQGVQCPECGALGMERLRYSWLCKKCKISSADAHLKALDDYALLISGEITNKQCRQFLLVNNRGTAHSILRNSDYT